MRESWPELVGEPLYVCDNAGRAFVVRRFANGEVIFGPPIHSPVARNGVFTAYREGGMQRASDAMIALVFGGVS